MPTKKEPQVQSLTPQEFRCKLACLTDPSIKTDGVKESLINEAVDFVAELPIFYSDSLDRMSLWDRIGNGLVAASQKCNGDVELFINQVLMYIKADVSKVAASDRLGNMMYTMSQRDKAWKETFLRQFQEYHYLIIVKSRMTWNNRKQVK